MSQFIILFLLCVSIHNLHLSTNDDNRQYAKLVQQQNQFKNKISYIKDSIQLTKEDLRNQKEEDRQIQILEKGIKKERQLIFDASTLLFLNQSLLSDDCQMLKQKQKLQFLNKVKSIEKQVIELKRLASSISEYGKIDQIRTEIQKQLTDIQAMKESIDQKCQKHYIHSPTVYQTNLLSKNWLSGDYEMKDIIQIYVERAKTQANITNCQLENPFFNGIQCITCPENTPYFDMKTEKCIQCSDDYGVDAKTRKCILLTKNSNFEVGENYILGSLTYLPQAKQNLQYCPEDRPFFNETICQSCSLPKNYWNVEKVKCQQCEKNLVFDINIQKCVEKKQNKLTNLKSSWITFNQNIKTVLEQRVNILKDNETNSLYSQCSQNSPYFDNITCISCPSEFNLDTLRCSHAPEGQKYDKNLRKYAKQQIQSMETDPKAQNYITLLPLADSSIKNCNKTHPFFDGITCINCEEPFPIFNYNINECVACDAVQYYDSASHKCKRRKWVYAGGNQKRLMASQTYGIEDYKKEIAQALQEDPEALAVYCEDRTEYPAITKCVKCKQNQVFYLKTKTCFFCDGHIDSVTLMCIEKVRYMTNLKAKNILFIGTTKQEEKQMTQILLDEHSRWKTCPIQTPYSNQQMNKCFSCDENKNLYNYTSKECTNCPEGSKFVQLYQECQKQIFQTNLNSSILLPPSQTIANYKKQLQQQKIKFITKVCPEDKPFSFRGESCFSCFGNTLLYNVTDNLCTECKMDEKYFKQIYQCMRKSYLTDLTSDNLVESDNYTIQDIAIKQEQLRKLNFYEDCSSQNPYGSIDGCINCPSNSKYFSLETKTCQVCPLYTEYSKQTKKCISITYFTNIEAQNIIGTDNLIKEIKENYEKEKVKGPAKMCDPKKPYEIKNRCSSCPIQNPYFSIDKKKCLNCEQNEIYVNEKHSCERLYFIANLKNMKNFIVKQTKQYNDFQTKMHQLDKKDHKKKCPPDQPFTSGDIPCFNCKSGQYLSLSNLTCIQCQNYKPTTHTCQPKPQKYPNLTHFQWIVTKSKAQDIIKKSLELKKGQNSGECEQFYNWKTKNCVTCGQNKYFNYDTFQCEQCTSFDVNVHKCMERKNQGSFYTNLKPKSLQNIIYGGFSIGQLTNQQTLLKNKYPGIKQCPEQTPYFDGYSCIFCPSYKKYFNLRYKACQTCLSESKLDEKNHDCVDSAGNPVQKEPGASAIYEYLFGGK